MPTPILPALRQDFALTASQVGLVSSSFAAGMFFAVMVIPTVSDRRGRRPVLAVALACTTVGFFTQGLVLSLHWSFKAFLWARFCTGVFAGANPIFKAYLADVVPASRLPQFMIYREASATLAFVIGPTLGGHLASLPACGAAGPLYATALAHAVAAAIIVLGVEESLGLGSRGASGPGARSETDAEPVRWGFLNLIFLLSFVYVISQCCISSFFPLLMTDRFGAAPREIGVLTTWVSLGVLAFQVLGYQPMYRLLGLERTGAVGALGIFLGLIGFGFDGFPFWLAAVIYALGVASFPATIPTLLTRAVPSSRRGLALGLDSIANNVCRVITPFCLGILYNQGHAICFSAAALPMLGVMATLLVMAARGRRRTSPK